MPETRPRGEKHHMTTFTGDQIASWRDRVRSGVVSITGLARELSIPKSTLFGIIRGTTWGHVPGAVPGLNVSHGTSGVAR